MVRVAPRSSRNAIAGEHDGALKVRVQSAPVEGAANAELIHTLARAFNVPARFVEITGGQTAKLKRVRVCGACREQLESLAAAK